MRMCIIVPNFALIDQTVAKMWSFVYIFKSSYNYLPSTLEVGVTSS